MKNRWRTWAVLAAAAALGMPAQADDIGTVVAKLKAKYGKYETLVKDLTMNMEVTVQDGKNAMTSENTMYYKEPKFRMDSKISMGQGGAMTTSVIFDGAEMWMVSMMGTQKLADKDQMKYQRERSWRWWSWLTENGRVTGSEESGGYDCWVIEFPEAEAKSDDKSRPGFSKLWLAKEPLVQVKAEAPYEKKKKAVFVYSDIKPAIGKMEMPHKTETFVDGKLMSTAVIKSVEYNKNLPDDLFSAAKAKSENKGMGGMLKGLVPGGQ
jgi:outer membrane lipoprotein-sorting protein